MSKGNENCRFCLFAISGGEIVPKCGITDKKIGDDDVCDNTCPNYKSRYIEFPITVNSIVREFGDDKPLGHEVGDFVAVKPCGDEYGGKTYFGILLGDLPIDITVSFNTMIGELTVRPLRNPAIYVPGLKKIVYGAESWWTGIKTEEDLKDITAEDINNTWYVKLIKEIFDKGE